MECNIKIDLYIKCSKTIRSFEISFWTNVQVLKNKNKPVDVIPPIFFRKVLRENYPIIVTIEWT